MNTEKEEFSIKETINQTPFDSFSAQTFFKKWAEINDDIKTDFISREEWEKRKEKGCFENQTLFLPNDLHLWEMVGIMEKIDKDTFSEKRERSEEKKEKMETLGKMFTHAAEYISDRLLAISEGKEIAEAMSDEFFAYGKLLENKKEKEQKEPLSAKETEEIDQWIFGENIVHTRLQTTENEEEKEEKRRETLAQFFRTAEKAFALQNKNLSRSAQKEFYKDAAPIHSAFLQKIETAIRGKIEKPKWELSGALLRRGEENILNNLGGLERRDFLSSAGKFIGRVLKKKEPEDFLAGEETLAESLHLSEMKEKLEEVRKTGDLSAISEKESEIALKIQTAVSEFPYRLGMNNPSDIVEKKYINCVGASLIGGTLLSEAGIAYLPASVPEHSLTFLVTSNGKVIWQDMLAPEFNEEIKDDVLEGKNKEGKTLTVSDIVAFSKSPSVRGLSFFVKGENFEKKLPVIEKGEKIHITLFSPEDGLQNELLSNTAFVFIEQKKFEEAAEICRFALSFSPNYLGLYYNLGYSLFHLKRYDEAIAEYKKAIAINPEYYLGYYGIGIALLEKGDNKGAKSAFEKTLSIRSDYRDAHIGLAVALSNLGDFDSECEKEIRTAIFLNDRIAGAYFSLAEFLMKKGKNEEAEMAYKDFLARADEMKDMENIEKAKSAIERLNV